MDNDPQQTGQQLAVAKKRSQFNGQNWKGTWLRETRSVSNGPAFLLTSVRSLLKHIQLVWPNSDVGKRLTQQSQETLSQKFLARRHIFDQPRWPKTESFIQRDLRHLGKLRSSVFSETGWKLLVSSAWLNAYFRGDFWRNSTTFQFQLSYTSCFLHCRPQSGIYRCTDDHSQNSKYWQLNAFPSGKS